MDVNDNSGEGRRDVGFTWVPVGDGGEAAKILARGVLSDLVNLPEWQIRERSFFGDISLEIDGVEFHYRHVPVFDFLFSWRYSLDALVLDGTTEMELAERAGPTRLALSGPDVSLRHLSTGASASCTYVELLRAVLRFGRDVLEELTRAHPDLLVNDAVEQLYRDLGMRGLGEEQFARHSAAMAKRHQRTG